MDEKPSEVVEKAASLGLDLRKYVDCGQLFMLSFGSLSSQKEADAVKVASDLASYITRSGATRLIIDPLGPLIAQGSGEQAQEVIRALQQRLKTTNLITLNCASPSDGGAEWKDYPVHGVVQIGFRRKQRSLARTILVSKMRATPLDLKEREFAIVNERGIVIEEIGPKPVVSRPVAFKAPELSQPSSWDA
jgi:KaiC/GvpD/RAD55 family RecA-like ATPase